MTEKSTDLVEARVIREEDWALDAWRARRSFPDMRRLAMLPLEEGGLGYALSESALRGLVAQARKRHGDTTMTRDERVERQQMEIDERARAARYDLARAHAELNRPRPSRDEYPDPDEWDRAFIAWAKGQDAATRLVESADKRLAAAMKDERDLHGLNAPTRIEADVTTRDAVTEELNAMLERAGRAPVDT